ncbi:MAG: type III-B CRISPR module RAMP protein Cmr4 [Anaerolineales bacterium]|nr:type III-B CRISPR module RAMP protein Cmr4 [Anaerolineales bacterium]
MDAKLLFVQALSPLHAGTGRGVGVIDLPIAREKATNIPFLPGSSLKGVFRETCDPKIKEKIFGPETDNADAFAGSVNFTDARLVLLPVRSLRGVFAWVTSPMLLRRFVRDAADVKITSLPQIPSVENDNQCLIANQSVAIHFVEKDVSQVVLEDLPILVSVSTDATGWAEWLGNTLFGKDTSWSKELQSRFCVVSDDVLGFLLETATEITARIRLDSEKKTVERGALWYEESLPSETILVSLVIAAPVNGTTKAEVFTTVQSLTKNTLQFGGNATVGRGLCKTTLFSEAAS